jgi:peptide-methionine (S)-S-oxide reductase
MSENTEIATLGGGCFWCVEAVLELLEGVILVESGYSGGWAKNPSYREVCAGQTDHAEVVQVTFDPTKISYRDLVIAFLLSHDPTTLNRQGADVGTQYRSVIFYHTEEQKKTAEEVIREIGEKKIYPQPIVTQIAPAATFYKAEDYHQEYFRNNPEQGYCAAVIAPKVTKFRKMFLEQLKKK